MDTSGMQNEINQYNAEIKELQEEVKEYKNAYEKLKDALNKCVNLDSGIDEVESGINSCWTGKSADKTKSKINIARDVVSSSVKLLNNIIRCKVLKLFLIKIEFYCLN